MWPFSDFQCGFRSSCSTADLPTVVSDRIARGLVMSAAVRAAVHEISKGFTCWSFSQTQVLWNFKLGISSFFQ